MHTIPAKRDPARLTPEQATALQRLIAASAAVSAMADSGALGEGYDGAEPQRTNAVTALDELAEANQAAMGAFVGLFFADAPAASALG